ncbi:DUF6000 family protein [uncultured Maribacter sp.]|uniref:DUF6000 family protein n=1 Tax=uncultured Maribacter sp. TaxID=431308 RepID=UPI00260F3068|nr:DUF6000 family protein [uncultured Maribacter sp.]
MDDKTKKAIELHSAGATVRHQNPFEELESYKSESEIDKKFIDKWVIPFYMVGIHNTDEFISNYSKVKSEVNIEIAKQLFGDFNWRTRIVGAYFSAIENYVELEDIIGTHLLKSEVCYAGGGYCFALASFNTEKGINYLKRYLDYYLTKKDLHFDQRVAMSAIKWTDKQNGTNLFEEYMPKFKEWVSDKYAQDIELSFSGFENQMVQLERIKASR